MSSNNRAQPPWPTAPGNNATIIMLSTAPRAAGGVGQAVPPTLSAGQSKNRMAAVTLTWLKNDQVSAANGLRVYASDDAGATWIEIDLKDDLNVPSIGAAAPVQVPILAAGQEWRETLNVSHLKDVAIEYTAGATGPTAVTGWRGIIAVELDDVVVVRA